MHTYTFSFSVKSVGLSYGLIKLQFTFFFFFLLVSLSCVAHIGGLVVVDGDDIPVWQIVRTAHMDTCELTYTPNMRLYATNEKAPNKKFY